MKKDLPGSHANLERVGKWVPSPTRSQNHAWQPSHSANRQGQTHTVPSARMGGSGWGQGYMIPKKQPGSSEVPVLRPGPLEVQCLQTTSFSLVPCALGGGPSVEEWMNPLLRAFVRGSINGHTRHPQSRERRQGSYREEASPLFTSPAQRPSGSRQEGEEEGILPLQGSCCSRHS